MPFWDKWVTPRPERVPPPPPQCPTYLNLGGERRQCLLLNGHAGGCRFISVKPRCQITKTVGEKPNETTHFCLHDAGHPGSCSFDPPARTLVDGEPVPDDGSHRVLKPNGQQKGYVVLSAEERAKGFKRPVRRSYVHVGNIAAGKPGCGTTTTMGQALAETYATNPYFYDSTFCCQCGKHFPVGPADMDGEFIWANQATEEYVGT